MCGFVIALWVRSYWWDESLNWRYSTTENFHLGSDSGVVFVARGTLSPLYPPWPVYTYANASGFANQRELIRMPKLIRTATISQIEIPCWLLFSVTVATAVLPWIPWARRFSLRTMLIATGLIAVILGVVVGTAR
jgi:hypothetical protein